MDDKKSLREQYSIPATRYDKGYIKDSTDLDEFILKRRIARRLDEASRQLETGGAHEAPAVKEPSPVPEPAADQAAVAVGAARTPASPEPPAPAAPVAVVEAPDPVPEPPAPPRETGPTRVRTTRMTEEEREQCLKAGIRFDRDRIKSELAAKTIRTRLQKAAVLLMALFLLWLGLAQSLGLFVPGVISRAVSPRVFFMINLIVISLITVVSLDVVMVGLKSFVRLKLNIETLLTLSLLFSVLQSALLFFYGEQEGESYFILASVTAISVYYYYGFKLGAILKAKADFRLVNSKGDKFIVSRILEKGLLTEMEVTEGKCVGYICKNCSNLLKYFAPGGFGNYMSDKVGAYFAPMVLTFILVSGVGCAVSFKAVLPTVTAVLALLCICTPLSLPMLVNLPLLWVSKKQKRTETAVLGYDAVNSFADVNVLVVSDSDLFSAENVQLSGIKVFGEGRIDEIIINTASVFSGLNGPISEVLLRVVDQKAELLRPVSEIIYHDGKGVHAFVDETSVLVGTRPFMDLNRVEVPRDKAIEKMGGAGRHLLYVAFNGELVALVALTYSAGDRMRKWLSKLRRSGIEIAVRSYDPNITAEMVAEKYGLVPSHIRMLPSHFFERIDESIACDMDADAAIVSAVNNFAAFARVLINCVRLKNTIYINILVGLLSIIVGFILMAFILLSLSFSQVSPLTILIFQLLWLIPILLVSFVARFFS